MRKIFVSNLFSKDVPNKIKRESKDCLNFLDTNGPVIPGAVFVFPHKDLFNNKLLKVWLPSLSNVETSNNLFPSVLPFDKMKYLKNFFVPKEKVVVAIQVDNEQHHGQPSGIGSKKRIL